MDLLPYVESRAIREHLAAVGHRFTPLEAAVLIRLSDRSLPERNAAWHELMRCSEDVELIPREWFPLRMSLHEWLRQDIRRSERMRGVFEEGEPDALWRTEKGERFSSLAACLEALRGEGDVVRKTWNGPDRRKDLAEAMLRPDGGYEWIEVSGCGLPEPLSRMGLYAFWIDVPTPFRKGDRLRDKQGSLLTLTDDERWHMTAERRRELENNGSFMEMCVKGLPAEPPMTGLRAAEQEWLYLELDFPDGETGRGQPVRTDLPAETFGK